jgi:N-acyl-D-amino-acid deacylase
MGHYARDLKLFTLEEAIRKSTSVPAQKFRIDRRGVLQEGNFADIVIFDPDNIREVGVFGDPHHYPEGIDAVIVNGQVVIDNGEHTGSLPGQILRKR